jgi:hypothetical protein
MLHPVGGASVGVATASRAAQSILRIAGIRKASPLCVSAHVALDVLTSQTIGCMLCRCVVVACLSLEGERVGQRRWVMLRAVRFGMKLHLIHWLACDRCILGVEPLTVAAVGACGVVAWVTCRAHQRRVLDWCGHDEFGCGNSKIRGSTSYKMINDSRRSSAEVPQSMGASTLFTALRWRWLYLASPASSPNMTQRIYGDKDTANTHVSKVCDASNRNGVPWKKGIWQNQKCLHTVYIASAGEVG